MAKSACVYADLSGDLESFREFEPAIRKGLDHPRRAANGLVYNPPETPQCPYGFTDGIAKTGHLLFCSVLYDGACVQMERLCRKAKCAIIGIHLVAEDRARFQDLAGRFRLRRPDGGRLLVRFAANTGLASSPIHRDRFMPGVGVASDRPAATLFRIVRMRSDDNDLQFPGFSLCAGRRGRLPKGPSGCRNGSLLPSPEGKDPGGTEGRRIHGAVREQDIRFKKSSRRGDGQAVPEACVVGSRGRAFTKQSQRSRSDRVRQSRRIHRQGRQWSRVRPPTLVSFPDWPYGDEIVPRSKMSFGK